MKLYSLFLIMTISDTTSCITINNLLIRFTLIAKLNAIITSELLKLNTSSPISLINESDALMCLFGFRLRRIWYQNDWIGLVLWSQLINGRNAAISAAYEPNIKSPTCEETKHHSHDKINLHPSFYTPLLTPTHFAFPSFLLLPH